MIYIAFAVLLIYCFVSYKQGYKSGFEEGQRYAIFTLKGDIKK
jgi:hypothetical protein